LKKLNVASIADLVRVSQHVGVSPAGKAA